MAFSDILGIVDIFVTIIIGFFLAHHLSVKDSRLRSVKNFYIDELSKIQQDTNDALSTLLNNKMSFEKLVMWMNDMECRLIEYEAAVKNSLPIKMVSLQNLVGNQFDKISNLQDVNDQCKHKTIKLSTDSHFVVQKVSYAIHEYYANYIYQLNINRGYSTYHELSSTYKNCVDFYKTNQVNNTRIRSIWALFIDYILRDVLIALLILAFAIGIICLYRNYSRDNITEQEKNQEMQIAVMCANQERNEILHKIELTNQDINEKINEINSKLKIYSKRINNSRKSK